MPSLRPSEAMWWPATDMQEAALDCEAEMLFLGGAAGSLKTETLCIDAIQERLNPNFRGILFRESFPQLTDIIDKQHRLYKPLGANYNEQKKTWFFPSGAT